MSLYPALTITIWIGLLDWMMFVLTKPELGSGFVILKQISVKKGVLLKLGPSNCMDLCPMLALRGFLDLRSLSPRIFFYFFFLSFRRKSFDMISILGRPKCALVALGLYGVHFGTHSFRPGAASTAVVIES